MRLEKLPYLDFGHYLANNFPFKVQKISIDAAFSCPNRDGTKGVGGCTYCNNSSFTPDYGRAEISITEQLERGVKFFSHKYPDMRYLAYFQSFSNSYGPLNSLIEKYEEALAYPGVVGIIIGTRPDTVSNGLLSYLSELQKSSFVFMEYGIESTLNRTLKRVNRGHTFEEAVETIERTAQKKIPMGLHLILGLPGESRDEQLQHADEISRLPVTSIKLHQLQIVKGTKMAEEYICHPERFNLFEPDEYIELCVDFLERLNPNIYIDRFCSQSPKELLIAPDWGIKNYQLTAKIVKRLKERQSYQGRLYRNFE